jgi:hypothetical protein
VLESKRFRIHFVGDSKKVEPLVPVCERCCHRLQERWLPRVSADWTPKCDVYLYPTGREFERLTHVTADAWGFTDLAVGDGRVWERKLHVRTDDKDRLERVLVHELTHVVLADRFTTRPIPRWADEGIAVLSEPPERQQTQLIWLAEEAGQRRHYSLRDLTGQRFVPQDQRQGELFYAQSGALVDFLLTEQELSEVSLLKFVEDCERRGWDAAVSKWFAPTTPAGIEAAWRAWLKTRAQELAAVGQSSAVVPMLSQADRSGGATIPIQ